VLVGCPSIASDAGVAERLSAYLECQASRLDLAAFQGGLWHGLPAALVTAALTIYVAIAGYRLVLGRRYDLATLVFAFGRLGVVLVLTTGLNAYSSLIYNVATVGPDELAAMAAAPLDLNLANLTDTAHQAKADLDALHPGPVAPTAPAAPAAPAAGDPSPSAPTAPAANLGDAVFLLSCLGFGLAARLALALLLAAGPLFIVAALFDMSLGLTVGWFRALATLFLAQTGYMLSSSLELSFLAQEIDRVTSPASPISTEPLFLGVVFLAIGAGITLVAVMVGGGLAGLIRAGRNAADRPAADTVGVNSSVSPWRSPAAGQAAALSRAVQISHAAGDLSRRDAERMGYRVERGGQFTTEIERGAAPSVTQGAGLRRAGSWRASPSAAKRDARS